MQRAMVNVKQNIEGFTADNMNRKQTEMHRLFRMLSEEQLETLNGLAGNSQNKTAKVSAAKKICFAMQLRHFPSNIGCFGPAPARSRGQCICHFDVQLG